MSWFGGKKKSPPETPALPEAPAPQIQAAPTGPVDFIAVLTAAGIGPEVRERVVKAKQLLRSLPTDMPASTERAIVEAAFQAFDVPTEKIIQGASAEIEALNSFIQAGEDDKAAKLAAGESRIAELKSQIRDARALMDEAVAAQELRERVVKEEIATILPIVRFFGRDIPEGPPAVQSAVGAQGEDASAAAPPKEDAGERSDQAAGG